MRDALKVLLRKQDRVIRVIGQTEQGMRSEIEVSLHEWPLRNALVAHAQRILYTSLALSLATATLLFLAVRRLIVRPMSRFVAHMTAYRDDPEDQSRIIAPESGARELRQAETALRDLELQLTGALRQRERLAGLGSAVAKISHDLRNMLTTAQLTADRIEGIEFFVAALIAERICGLHDVEERRI
jgi:signal transduction histidine kinase